MSATFQVAEIIRNEQPRTVIGWSVETAVIVGSARVLTRRSWRYIQQVSQSSLTMVEAAIVGQADQIIVMEESALQACERVKS